MNLNQPQHRAEPTAETIAEWRFEENLHRTHGVKPEILPGFGKHRKPSIMATPEAAQISLRHGMALAGLDPKFGDAA